MIQTDQSSISYFGNNSIVTPYPVPFYFFTEEALVVTVKDQNQIEDIQALGTDYTVDGEGNPNGGTIVMKWAVPATSSVTIFRNVPITQLTSYEEADAFPAKSHEKALDKLTMICQQNSRLVGTGTGDPETDIGSAFRVTEASGGINSVAKKLDSVLGIDAQGNAILRSSEDLLNFMGSVGSAWQTDADRFGTTPSFVGQLGLQINTQTLYIGQSTTAGDWLPFLRPDGIVTAINGKPVAIPHPAGDLVGTTASQTLTNKTIENVTLINPSGITKENVGLGNCDNVSDINKPVSAATNAALSAKQPYSEKGFANGYASLDASGKVPTEQLPAGGSGGGLIYKGSWNAATNTPTIPAASAGNNGWFYVVNVAGTTNIDGISSWAVGDWITSNGTIWQKIPQTDAVSSVNGRTGAVVVNKTDVGLPNVDNTSDATKNSAAGTLTNKVIDGANNTLSVRLGNDVTGNLPVSRLNNGTGAGPGTWWCGDNSWKAPVGTGDVNGPNGSTDGEIPVFSGATGKVLRRYTGPTGFPKIAQNAAPVVSLIGNADVLPSIIHGHAEKTTDLVDADEFVVWDSTVSALRRIPASRVRHLPGEVVQTVDSVLTAEIVIEAQFLASTPPPYPNTTGTEYISASITPKYSNSKILVTLSSFIQSYCTAPAVMMVFYNLFFVTGTTNAFYLCPFGSYGDGQSGPIMNTFVHSPATTSSRTYSVRGIHEFRTGKILNSYINGFGWVGQGFPMATHLVLQEIKQ